jgi:hypothetical protein
LNHEDDEDGSDWHNAHQDFACDQLMDRTGLLGPASCCCDYVAQEQGHISISQGQRVHVFDSSADKKVSWCLGMCWHVLNQRIATLTLLVTLALH